MYIQYMYINIYICTHIIKHRMQPYYNTISMYQHVLTARTEVPFISTALCQRELDNVLVKHGMQKVLVNRMIFGLLKLISIGLYL